MGYSRRKRASSANHLREFCAFWTERISKKTRKLVFVAISKMQKQTITIFNSHHWLDHFGADFSSEGIPLAPLTIEDDPEFA